VKIRKHVRMGDPLTPDEEKIMDFLAFDGLRTKEVAAQMKTTRAGIQYSLILVMKKLGAKTLYQAVSRYTLMARQET